MKIVIRAPNWVGDHVMAVPFYRAVRDKYPKAQLALVCSENVASLPLPFEFDSVFVLKNSERRKLKGLLSYAKTLRAEGFDLGFCLPASFSATFLIFAARVRQRLGFYRGLSAVFLDHGVPWRARGENRHRSQVYLSLLEGLFPEKHLSAYFSVSSTNTPEKKIVLAPGSMMGLRVWPYFAELSQLLSESFPEYEQVFVGTQAEQERWRSFLSDAKGIVNLIGKTSLREVFEVCRKASVVIANDSGVAHVAASLSGAPSLVFFGPGNPGHVAPLGTDVHIARLPDLPCSPCESSHCHAPYGYQECLRGILPAVALEQVRRVLEG